MNAQEKGREHGFATFLSYARISKSAFAKIGEHSAKRAYKTEQKQQEYLKGWMANWNDSPTPPASDEDILTY